MASYVKEKNGTVTLMYYIEEQGEKKRKKVRGFRNKREAHSAYLQYVTAQKESELQWRDKKLRIDLAEEEIRLREERIKAIKEERERLKEVKTESPSILVEELLKLKSIFTSSERVDSERVNPTTMVAEVAECEKLDPLIDIEENKAELDGKTKGQEIKPEIHDGEKIVTKEYTDMTIRQCYEIYTADTINYKKLTSCISEATMLRLHVVPHLGDYSILELTTTHIKDWQTLISKKTYSRGSIQNAPYKWKFKSKIYCAFTAMINYIKLYYPKLGLEKNVVSAVGNFKNLEPKVKMKFWTQEDFNKFSLAIDNFEAKLFFTLLYYSGCRKGEAIALQWADVLWEKSSIDICKTLNRKGIDKSIAKYALTSPKTKAGYREIMLPGFLMDMLKVQYEEHKKLPYFNQDLFVFGGAEPLAEQTIRRRMIDACEASGVQKIRVHDIRHSHIALLISKGADIMIVAERLGHSDVSETLNTYGHMLPSKQRSIVDMLDRDKYD